MRQVPRVVRMLLLNAPRPDGRNALLSPPRNRAEGHGNDVISEIESILRAQARGVPADGAGFPDLAQYASAAVGYDHCVNDGRIECINEYSFRLMAATHRCWV